MQNSPFDPQYPASLVELAREASVCTRCVLSRTRTQAVFSDGNPQAPIMLIGEGPGQQEADQRNAPLSVLFGR